jgi:hypothetical protein
LIVERHGFLRGQLDTQHGARYSSTKAEFITNPENDHEPSTY